MMMEDALKALNAADAPPARDLAFEIAVMARIERDRFHRALARNAALALAATCVLALAMPGIERAWFAASGGLALTSLQQLWPADYNASLALGIALTAANLFLPWWRVRD